VEAPAPPPPPPPSPPPAQHAHLRQQSRQNLGAVRRNAARNAGNVYVQPNRAFLLGAILFYLPQIITVIVLLPSRWNTKACDYTLQLWLVGQAVRLVFVLLGWIGLYHRSSAQFCMRNDRNVTFFGVIWFVMGNIWFYRAWSAPSPFVCPHHTIYYLTEAMLICAYVPFVLPVLLCCVSIPIIWCCLPNAIRAMNLMQRDRGADDRLLKSIRTVPFVERRYPPEDAVCAICMMNYVPDQMIHELPCRHHFHQQCSSEWLRINATCPICRWDLKREDGGRANPQS